MRRGACTDAASYLPRQCSTAQLAQHFHVYIRVSHHPGTTADLVQEMIE